jgi:hypothetical protein
MIVRLIVVCLIIFLGFVFASHYSRNKYENRKIYIKIVSLILILQSGLRNVAVGSDTYTYFISFQETKIMTWRDIFYNFISVYKFGRGKDPGYPLFEKIVSTFTSEYQILLLIIAVVFFTALGNFILKNTKRLSDVVIAYVIYSVLFYSFFSVTGHRQTLTTAAALFSFELIKKRRFIEFTLIIIIMSTIHKSLLIFFLFYFIAPVKNAKYLNRLTLLLLPLFMINRNAFSSLLKKLGGFEDYGINGQAGTFTFTLIFLLMTILALWQSQIILKNNKNAVYYFNAFTVAILFIPLTWVNPSAMRVVQYFSIFMLLFVPEIIYSFSAVSKNFTVGMTVFVTILLIALMVKANLYAAPYGFFWEEMQLQGRYSSVKLIK